MSPRRSRGEAGRRMIVPAVLATVGFLSLVRLDVFGLLAGATAAAAVYMHVSGRRVVPTPCGRLFGYALIGFGTLIIMIMFSAGAAGIALALSAVMVGWKLASENPPVRLGLPRPSLAGLKHPKTGKTKEKEESEDEKGDDWVEDEGL